MQTGPAIQRSEIAIAEPEAVVERRERISVALGADVGPW